MVVLYDVLTEVCDLSIEAVVTEIADVACSEDVVTAVEFSAGAAEGTTEAIEENVFFGVDVNLKEVFNAAIDVLGEFTRAVVIDSVTVGVKGREAEVRDVSETYEEF